MTAGNRNPEFDIFGNKSTAEALHDVLLAILTEGKERSQPGYYFNDQDDERHLILFSRMAGDGTLRVPINFERIISVIDASIRVSDDFEDSRGLGKDADGDPTVLITPDSRDQIYRRSMSFDYTTINPHNGNEVKNEWVIEYEADSEWRMYFYKGLQPRGAEPGQAFREPIEEDMALFTAVLEHAANMYFSDDELDERDSAN